MATDLVVVMTLVKRLATAKVNLKAVSRIAGYRKSNQKMQGYADANADWQEVLTEVIEELKQ